MLPLHHTDKILAKCKFKKNPQLCFYQNTFCMDITVIFYSSCCPYKPPCRQCFIPSSFFLQVSACSTITFKEMSDVTGPALPTGTGTHFCLALSRYSQFHTGALISWEQLSTLRKAGKPDMNLPKKIQGLYIFFSFAFLYLHRNENMQLMNLKGNFIIGSFC